MSQSSKKSRLSRNRTRNQRDALNRCKVKGERWSTGAMNFLPDGADNYQPPWRRLHKRRIDPAAPGK